MLLPCRTLLPTALPGAAAVSRVLALLTVLRAAPALLRATDTCDAGAAGALAAAEPVAAGAATALPALLATFAAAGEALPALAALAAALALGTLFGWLAHCAAVHAFAARLGLMSCAAPSVLSCKRCCCCWLLLLCCQLFWM
jgi:hypothetical protein